MREYKQIRRTTEVLTKILCDTCQKEIQKLNIYKEAYLPSTVITAKREFSSDSWCVDNLEFCSVECFLKWAKMQRGAFKVYFPYDTLSKLITREEVENVKT